MKATALVITAFFLVLMGPSPVALAAPCHECWQNELGCWYCIGAPWASYRNCIIGSTCLEGWLYCTNFGYCTKTEPFLRAGVFFDETLIRKLAHPEPRFPGVLIQMNKQGGLQFESMEFHATDESTAVLNDEVTFRFTVIHHEGLPSAVEIQPVKSWANAPPMRKLLLKCDGIIINGNMRATEVLWIEAETIEAEAIEAEATPNDTSQGAAGLSL